MLLDRGSGFTSGMLTALSGDAVFFRERGVTRASTRLCEISGEVRVIIYQQDIENFSLLEIKVYYMNKLRKNTQIY